MEEELVAGVVGGRDADAEIFRDVQLFERPTLFGVAGINVGAALYVVEGGEDEVIFSYGSLLCELLGRGREDGGGLEVNGVLPYGFEVKRDD